MITKITIKNLILIKAFSILDLIISLFILSILELFINNLLINIDIYTECLIKKLYTL